jgi:hypothetical protein
MHPRICLSILVVTTCAMCGQVAAQSPIVEIPQTLPTPTVPKEMITTLRVAKVSIVLEETELTDVQRRLGGTIVESGDASTANAELCFYGTDANGRWGLSLDSGEMGGLRWIDSFTLQRLSPNAKKDSRCRIMRQNEGGIELPISLRLGLTEKQVVQLMGKPTMRYHRTLIFYHEHAATIHALPYTVSNIVAVALRGGVVWAIEVSKDSET